jgi:hypothetical protein
VTWRRLLLARCDCGLFSFLSFPRFVEGQPFLLQVSQSVRQVSPFSLDTTTTMEINPKVRNAAENGDLEQTVTGGPSQPGDVQVTDDVFGEVGADGPNYRNVGLTFNPFPFING